MNRIPDGKNQHAEPTPIKKARARKRTTQPPPVLDPPETELVKKTQEFNVTREEAQRALFMARALLLGNLAGSRRSCTLADNIQMSYRFELEDRAIQSANSAKDREAQP